MDSRRTDGRTPTQGACGRLSLCRRSAFRTRPNFFPDIDDKPMQLKKIAILTLAAFGLAATCTQPLAKTADEVRARCRAEHRPCVGLVLSGGGARGFAHTGVLDVIEELGIKIDVVTGTSMGSMVGGAYAAGYSAAEIRDIVLGVDWDRMMAPRADREELPWRLKVDDYKNLAVSGIEFGKDMPATEFVGYDRSSEQGRVLALVADGELRDELAQGVEGILVLDQTPFYAEMGGQVGDHGTIQGPNGTFQVTDVQKNKGGKFMHSGKVVSGTLSVGETVTASIDMERRKAIMRAHSATHLLDAALKKVLGDHVHQAGSLVEPDRLRFDFTHFEGITPEQLAQIDKLVNDAILEGYPVATEVLPIEEAKKKGAVAMFGEKYGDIVRVVEMGDFSMEFCGGTHLDNTAKAGPFRIKSEGSVASGVRRIEATVGRLSLDTMNRNQELLFHAAQVLKTTPGELAAKAEQQAAEMKELRHELEKFKSEASLGEARQFLTAAKNVGGLKVLTAIRNGMDANALRQMGDFLRDKAPDVVAVLASANGEKITFLAVCGPEAVKRGIKAGDLVKSVCAICGGKGGGKPDSAMGGGSDLLKLDDALATVDDFVAEKLK